VSSFDLEAFLTEISPDAPCGEDISYDADFLEMEKLAQGTEDTQMGDHIQEGEAPDWKGVQQKSLKLLERSRDLRLVLYLTISELSLHGLEGFHDGLALLEGIIERYWDHVFPLLDPEDDNDPTERMNIIGSLSPPATVMSDQDPMKFIPRLMAVPLCRPSDARLPTPCLRHILVASGEMTASESESGDMPTSQLIDAAFEQTEVEFLQTTDRLLNGSLEIVQKLDKMLIDRVGASSAPNFERLTRLLRQMQAKTSHYLESRGYGSEGGGGQNDSEDGGDSPDAGSAAANGPSSKQLSGQIFSNQDVRKALEMVIVYYEQNEPSSPVPLLIKRAKRLVGKSFVDIIRDISPDAMSQVKNVSGEED
jgi:type VI secretion system protein ImpA